jgi:hypothetical protein
VDLCHRLGVWLLVPYRPGRPSHRIYPIVGETPVLGEFILLTHSQVPLLLLQAEARCVSDVEA